MYDDNRLSALTDITPSLYYLLGHRPIRSNPLFGRPLFAETRQELEKYRRTELFLASDERAVYGLLADNGRFLYTTYDFPAESFLFDLSQDPNAEHNLLTKPLQEEYAQQIIEHSAPWQTFTDTSPEWDRCWQPRTDCGGRGSRLFLRSKSKATAKDAKKTAKSAKKN